MVTNQNMRNILNENGGKFPAVCPIGGYSYLYIDERDNILCPTCANKMIEDDITDIKQIYIHWEGLPLECEECHTILDSEYGIDGME